MIRNKLSSIDSLAELRRAKTEIQQDIDELGMQIVSSTKDLARKGVKVTAVGVASVLATKAISAYVRWRREDPKGTSAEEFVAMAAGKVEGVDPDEVVSDLRSKAAIAVQWYQIIARIIEVGRVLYHELVSARQEPNHLSEEE